MKYTHGQHGVLCIVALYEPNSPGIESEHGKRLLFCLNRPERVRGSNKFLFHVYEGIFHGSKAALM